MRFRLLIVEDNEALRTLFGDGFERCDFEVLLAASASEAKQLAACHEVDAVLTDADLAGLSGIELCRALRRQFRILGRSIPVWIMTGTYDPEIAKRAAVAGSAGVLEKPFPIVDVAQRIRATLETCNEPIGRIAQPVPFPRIHATLLPPKRLVFRSS